MTNHRHVLGRWGLTLAALVLILSVGMAQAGRGGTAQPRPLPTPSLMEQARASGSVSVIIGVAAPYQSEALLSAEAVTAQRAGIAAARASVLAEIARYAPNARASSMEWTIPFLALRVSADGLTALQQSRSVVGIYPDTRNRLMLDSALPAQDVPQAHIDGHTGAGAVVAVLDTGVAKNHEFLAGQVVAEACYSTNNGAEAATSLCPNGAEVQTGSGAANPNKCKDAPGCYHGTHVSGIVAGHPIGIPGGTTGGIAPDARIYAIQVFTEITDFSYCFPDVKCIVSYTSDMISALQKVNSDRALYNIASVNLSLGAGQFFSNCDASEAPTKNAIDTLLASGIATIIASGNNGFIDAISAPACVSTAISVGSVTDGGSVSFFSNANFTLDLWGVGSDVVSSVFDDEYESLDGTSMATPMVAGAWAVIKSIKPDAGVNEVLSYFQATGIDIADVNVTTDLIQLDNAADMAAGQPAPTNVLTDPGFEGALTPRVSGWTKSGSGMKIACDSLHAHTGQCYVKASSSTNGTVSQTFVPINFTNGMLVTFSAYLNGNKTKSGSVTAKITLINGNSQKLKLKAGGTFAYGLHTTSTTLKNDANKVKIIIKGTAGGKLYVDDLMMSLNFIE